MKSVEYIKKYWYWVIIMFLIPFLTEFVLFHTPVISKFSNETWFSFMGSYIGAIVTLVVMVLTFNKSDTENKKLVKQQIRQKNLDMQNEKILGIIQTLLLDGYVFCNPDTVGENMDRYFKKLQYIQFDTIMLQQSGKDTLNKGKLLEKLLELQKEEMQILNELYNNTLKNPESNPMQELLQTGLRLNEKVNGKREEIKFLYESYLNRVYQVYYE